MVTFDDNILDTEFAENAEVLKTGIDVVSKIIADKNANDIFTILNSIK